MWTDFDATVDYLLIDNVTVEPLLSESLGALKDPITEGETLRLLSPTTNVADQFEKGVREFLETVCSAKGIHEK